MSRIRFVLVGLGLSVVACAGAEELERTGDSGVRSDGAGASSTYSASGRDDSCARSTRSTLASCAIRISKFGAASLPASLRIRASMLLSAADAPVTLCPSAGVEARPVWKGGLQTIAS